jgi:hypothetical protein
MLRCGQEQGALRHLADLRVDSNLCQPRTFHRALEPNNLADRVRFHLDTAATALTLPYQALKQYSS